MRRRAKSEAYSAKQGSPALVRRSARAACRTILTTSLLVAAGCGESARTDIPVEPPASRRGVYPGISASLTIDADALDNYADPFMPVHLRQLAPLDNTPADNPITDAGATLGRVLFFDRQLSLRGTASCASCHLAAAGFGDTVRFSTGFAGQQNLQAQSMRLLNLRFFKPGTGFWDRRAPSLEELGTAPIRDSVEMGFTSDVGGIDSLFRRMRTLPYYPELFMLAFGDSTISDDRLRRALAQYLRSLVSRDSRFDRAAAQAPVNTVTNRPALRLPFGAFTAEENRGKFLFLATPTEGGVACFNCHTIPTFNLAPGSTGNGLDAGETRRFRAPSLKSVATSRHFMHDGRFSSLEQVVEFYNSGIQESPVLDPRLRDAAGFPQRLRMASADKAALVAFLSTLTDDVAETDPRYRTPFRH